MGGTRNQKLKILYLMNILLERTDERHSLSVDEIINLLLEEYGISAERKSIYADFDVLREYGLNIGVKRSRNVSYYISNRSFELSELKLLVDAVESSRFITCKKNSELKRKLAGLASVYEAILLQRKIYIADRLKRHDESIFQNIDAIHNAILEDSKISFVYYDWTLDKARGLRREGHSHCVSPWALTLDDRHYNMVAYDTESRGIKQFRVDKMLNIKVMSQPREGKGCFEAFDMSVFSRRLFGSFGGSLQSVVLHCDNSMAGVIIDHFGTGVDIQTEGDSFSVTVTVVVSPLFLSWIMSFGGRIIIRSPAEAVEQIRVLAESVITAHNSSNPERPI